MTEVQKKNIRPLLILILIGALIIFGLPYFMQRSSKNQAGNQDQQIPSVTIDPAKNWTSLIDENRAYQLQYPIEAKAETTRNESVISYMGQKQIASGRTQTELFDGYAFRIGRVIANPDTDTEKIAREERNNAESNCIGENGTVSKLESTTLQEQPAFQYSAQGCYIDYTETFVSFNGVIYRISQSYVGDAPDQAMYKEITKRILASLQFID